MGNSLKENLYQKRVLLVFEEITEESCAELMSKMLEFQLQSEDPITILINSRGGDTLPTLALCDLMKHVITAPVHGIVIGMCHSSATFILASCSTRRATSNSNFVIHSAVTNAAIRHGKMTEKRLNDFLKETSIVTEMYVRFYQEQLGLTEDRVEELLSRGDQEDNSRLTVKEALSIGLITEIVSGKVGIFPSPAPSE